MKKYIISYNSENDFFCYDVNDRRCSRKQAAENFKMILTEISNTLLYLEKGNNCVIYFPKFKVEFKNYKEIIIKDNDICRLIYICRKKAKYRLNTLLAASVLLVAAGTSFVLSKDYKKSDVNTITSKTKVERPINIDEIDKSLISSVVEKTESKPIVVDLGFDIGTKREETIQFAENNPKIMGYINKYCSYYGIDPNQMLAMIMQESYGRHRTTIDSNGAVGICQIQWDEHKNSKLKAYNFITGEYDYVTVSWENVTNLEKHIQISAIIFRNYLERNNFNNILNLQAYNFGCGAINKVLRVCEEEERLERNYFDNNPCDITWVNYLSSYSGKDYGDINYIRNVYQYMITTSVVNLDKDGNEIVTDYVNFQKQFF